MRAWRAIFELPRPVWILAGAMLLNRAGTMVLPFLVLYLTRRIGLTAGQAGLVFALYGLGSLVASPIAGRLADRRGARQVMTACLALSGAILLVYPLARTGLAAGALTVALSLAGEGFRPASMAFLSKIAGPGQRKQAFALNRLAINLGMSIGPALGGVLIGVWPPALFLVDGGTCLLAAAVFTVALGRITAFSTEADSGSEAQSVAHGSTPPAHRDRAFLGFLGATILIGLVFFQLDAAMPLYVVRDLHVSERSFGLLFTVNTVLILLCEVPLNGATSHWSHRRSLMTGAFLCAMGFGSFFFARDFTTSALSVVVWTFGEMILFPSMSAYTADIAPAARTGEYMGLYTTSFGIAFTLGPLIGTAVLEQFGGKVLWCAALVVGLVASVIMGCVREPAMHDQDREASPAR